MTSGIPAAALTAHDLAVALDETTYVDPVSGYMVFTSVEHLRRGYCCENDCRHCPYGRADDGSVTTTEDGRDEEP